MSLPDACLPNIRCSACNKYLSYFPIYLSQNDEGSICGRCSELLVVDGNYLRNTTYEAIARHLKFPCIYNHEGCIEKLLPSQVANHEELCPHRTISCALDCIWQGSVNELITHVVEVHPDTLLRNGEFEMNILNSYETSSFMIYKDEIFSVRQKFDITDQIFECSLLCYKALETITFYFYEITVFNGKRDLSVKFPLKSADTFLPENTTKIEIESVKNMLDKPATIIGSIKIFTNDKNLIEKPKQPNPAINTDLLSELECPVCLHYIIPPIFQCVSGHSICEDCKTGRSECPTCKQPLKEDSKNITLEKVAYLLTYPCKFTDYGCDYAEKPGKIKQHQKFCIYGIQACPLKDFEDCQWEGAVKDLSAHISKKHHENMLEIDDLIVFIDKHYFRKEDNQCFIKKLANMMFKLHYRYVNNRFYWAMQFIGPTEEAKNYKFEIDITDNTNNNQKLFLRSFCGPQTDENETFSDPSNYVFLEKQQLESFITDQLNYSVRITK